MLSYGDHEEIGHDKPTFRFIPVNKETIHRLIIKAANAKNDKEFQTALQKN